MTSLCLRGGIPFLMLAVAACGTPQNATVTDDQKEMAIIAKEITTPEEEKIAHLPEPPIETETPRVIEKEEEPIKEIPKVSVLMGKTVSEIEAVFGKPVLRRKDKPAEVWQYLTGECALHLIFYPEDKKKSGKLTVQHIAMNDRKQAVTSDARACFGSQLKKVGNRAQTLS